MKYRLRSFPFWLVMLLGVSTRMSAEESAPMEQTWEVTFVASKDSSPKVIAGRILIEAQDGGILFEDRVGVIWNITPDQQISRTSGEGTYALLPADELAASLKNELGESTEIVRSEHYIIATAGNRSHAEWCVELFEELMTTFLAYWESSELSLELPESPLLVVIHRDRATFAEAARIEAGPEFAQANGYYSMKTNRVVLFDPTGNRKPSTNRRSPVRSRSDIQRFMAANPHVIATTIHEATHQLAYNSGMHTRYADNPLWLTEGMALYFEVPDKRVRTGWGKIGGVNRPRLDRFRKSLSGTQTFGRPIAKGTGENSLLPSLRDARLTSLVADDTRFSDPQAREVAYAEAWALTHFLLANHRHQYIRYIAKCSEGAHLRWKSREERLQDFKEVFNVTPDEMEVDLLRYVAKLGRR
ncbi:MAG: DUF1570 domain-containing protein [Planctomycetaceae bacterium]|nr:DUF1570 domain-containing protein [Planctomycetaceae bacterium]